MEVFIFECPRCLGRFVADPKKRYDAVTVSHQKKEPTLLCPECCKHFELDFKMGMDVPELPPPPPVLDCGDCASVAVPMSEPPCKECYGHTKFKAKE